MTGSFLMLYPLQVSASDFAVSSSINPRDLIIGLVVIAAIIAGIVFLNSKNKKGSFTKGPKTKGSPVAASTGFSGIFSGITLHRITKNIGLSSEQTKMLDYVFKNDQVTDFEKSLSSPALLDRHFKRAYRLIDQGSGSEEDKQRKLAVLFSTRNILENSAFGSITSTRQIKEDTTFIYTYGKDKINAGLITTKNENLVVEAPVNVLGSQIKIPKGTKLSILFFNKNNKGFTFETRIIGFATYNGHPTMHLAHSNQINFLSQRRFRRRQAAIACNMYLVYVEGSGKKQRLIVDKRHVSGTIADVSVGGCSIKIMTPVQVGARFKIEFTQGNANVAALGQVLRSNRAGMSTIIHVRFLKVSLKSMNIINAYVYEYGRE